MVNINKLLDKACAKKYLNPASLPEFEVFCKKNNIINIKVELSTFIKNEIKSELSIINKEKNNIIK
jgi:hypothetical protein